MSRIHNCWVLLACSAALRCGTASSITNRSTETSRAGRASTASPLTYVPANRAAARVVPPCLILHGTDDQDIRPRHSQELARRLVAAGAAVKLVLVQGASHILDNTSQRLTFGRVTQMVADFFARSLASG